MTSNEHLEWVDSKRSIESSIKFSQHHKKHYSQQEKIDQLNNLAIINWVLESAYIQD